MWTEQNPTQVIKVHQWTNQSRGSTVRHVSQPIVAEWGDSRSQPNHTEAKISANRTKDSSSVAAHQRVGDSVSNTAAHQQANTDLQSTHTHQLKWLFTRPLFLKMVKTVQQVRSQPPTVSREEWAAGKPCWRKWTEQHGHSSSTLLQSASRHTVRSTTGVEEGLWAKHHNVAFVDIHLHLKDDIQRSHLGQRWFERGVKEATLSRGGTFVDVEWSEKTFFSMYGMYYT